MLRVSERKRERKRQTDREREREGERDRERVWIGIYRGRERLNSNLVLRVNERKRGMDGGEI